MVVPRSEEVPVNCELAVVATEDEAMMRRLLWDDYFRNVLIPVSSLDLIRGTVFTDKFVPEIVALLQLY